MSEYNGVPWVTEKSLYALLDTELDGFLTWTEDQPGVGEIVGVILFTRGEGAEEYIHNVMPGRSGVVSVCKITKSKLREFTEQIVDSGVGYALIDPPSKAGMVRNYAIIDIKKLVARYSR